MKCSITDCDNEAIGCCDKCIDCMETTDRLQEIWKQKTEELELETDQLEADNG